MKKLLFIHGYGTTSAESGALKCIKEEFTDFAEVRGVEYTQHGPRLGIEQIRQVIDEYQPDLIIGSSLGGFFALQFGGIAKTIVMNPCLCPSKELGKLGMEHPEVFEPIEREFYADEQNLYFGERAKANTIGFFGTHDELFSYKDLFVKLFDRSDIAFDFDSGHHVDGKALKSIKQKIVAFYEQP